VSAPSTTIRERIRDVLIDARPGGLTMAAIAGAVSGPWRARDVEDAVRKLWEINELGRRADGTFVVTDQAPASKSSAKPSKREDEMDRAIARVAKTARRDGYSTKVRVRNVNPALLRPWCPTCRTKVTARPDGTCVRCHTQTGGSIEPPKPPRRRRRRKPLRKGQPGYGPVCPKCGGRKGVQAHTCHACRRKRRGGYNSGKVGGRRRGPTLITEELLEHARGLYASGLSLRQVAAEIHDQTAYKTKASCAEALYGHFKRRGWKLRPQREVTAARNFKHGRKTRAVAGGPKEVAYRHWLAQQRGWTAVNGPGRPACKAVKTQYPGKGQPCTRHAMQDSDYCWAHDPSRAAQRDAHLAAMRAQLDPEENQRVLQRARQTAQANRAAAAA